MKSPEGVRKPVRGSQDFPTWGHQLSDLYNFWLAGMPVEEIAQRLGRSKFSIRRKAEQKGLGPHPKEAA